MTDKNAAEKQRIGVVYGLAAYLVWGFFPLYFKAVEIVTPLEMVSHRICWSLGFLLLLIAYKRAWREMWACLTQPKALSVLALSSVLIGTNWLVFICSISIGEVLQSSLGYFINPLVSVLLGFVFLGERLGRVQRVSILLASLGVLYLAISYRAVPWIALILAFSFGLYGLIRKSLQVEPLVGLTVETLLLTPIAFFYLVHLNHAGTGHFLAVSGKLDLLISLAGIVTAVPLLLFTAATKRLQLATIGFLQYIVPTMHFLIAVFAFGEPFSHAELVSFLFIWCGLAIYSVHAYRSTRRAVAN